MPPTMSIQLWMLNPQIGVSAVRKFITSSIGRICIAALE